MKNKNIFRKTVFMLMTAATVCTGCGETGIATIRMITAMNGVLELHVAGTGTATINWGDGSAAETAELLPVYASEGFSDASRYVHTFSGTVSHTIIITGQDITHLDCKYMELTDIDVTKNTALEYLDCTGNQLASLDVTKNRALEYLDCADNKLASMDVSKNTELTYLGCSVNRLASLDVSKNRALFYLDCGVNILASLDVSKNSALRILGCADNQLTDLDVRYNTALHTLVCSSNLLTVEKLNFMFRTLNAGLGDKRVLMADNPGTDSCDRTIAEDSGWTVEQEAGSMQ